MVDFLLKFRLRMLVGFTYVSPQAPDAFGLNPPSQLVLRYHWLAFLNLVLGSKSLSSLLTIVYYKIDHI